jgi:iron complex outermembrane recepter protein
MKIIYNFTILFFLFLLNHSVSYTNTPETQRPATDANIFGHVIDAETGEHLPFVNLIIKGTRIGTITDATGHYLLTNLPVGKHTLVTQSLGYATAEVEFDAIARTTIEVDIKIVPTGINLDEIVLTSSPTASGFRYQPDAVFMGEQIQRRSEPSFGEMLNGQPGVAMRSFGSAPSRPVIRGMDGDRILVLENGERMGDIAHTSADHSISLDPLVASRVEVVRGPASLLYGSSALGGVINLMTTDIPDQWDTGITGVVSGQGASMNNMGAGFGRVTWGNLYNATSARFAMRQAGNITTPDGELPGTTMRNFDGAVGWGFNQVNLNGGLSLAVSDQAFEIPESPDDPNESVEIRARKIGLQGRFGRNLNGSFFDQAQLRFNVSKFDQQEVEIEFLENGQTDEETELEYDMLAFSSTLTLQHKPRGVFARGAVGFNLTGQSVDVLGGDIYTPGEQRISLATFTFQEVPLSNQLRFQFGVRLDFNNSRALANESFPDVSQSRNTFNYSGSIGLNFRPAEGMEIGGQLARSHRNPMVEELFASGPHLGAGVFEKGNVNLKDEIGHGADIFLKIKRQFLEFELAGFLNDFRNYIIFEPTGLVDEISGYPIFEYIGGEAMLMGGEMSLGVMITQGLIFNTGVDYVNGTRIIDNGANENLPVIPPFRFNNQLEYDFGRGWLGGSLQAVAAQKNVAPEEEITDGYTLLGFQAGYRLNFNGKHVIILRVTNALDTRYRDHLSRIEDRNFLMPGRNVNLTYRWFF